MLFKNPFQMKLLFAINSAFDLNSDSVVGWGSVNYLHEKFRLKCQIVCKLKVSRGKVGNPHKYLSLLIPTGVTEILTRLARFSRYITGCHFRLEGRMVRSSTNLVHTDVLTQLKLILLCLHKQANYLIT